MEQSRLAVVTGAGRGIGRAIAERIGRGRVRVVVADISEELAIQSCAAMRGEGLEVMPVHVDVSDEASVRDAITAIRERWGSPDVLVNNAGILSNTPYDQISAAEWNRVMGANLLGAMLMSQALLPGMQENGWGRIVNVASLAGRNGGVSVGPAYAASKAGLIGYTRHLAGKVAGFGVTVNVVAPGTTATDITAQFTAEQMAAINAVIPVRRLGTAEEISAAVAYLAGEDAGFTTGAVLDVNGGMYFG